MADRNQTWAIALLGIAATVMYVGVSGARGDAWDAPAGYYSGVTGTGSLLKSQLKSAMSAGHIQRSYGDFRYASRIFDADPARSGNILLVYNRQSVSGNWDSGATWNREHVWPVSRQPGSCSNSTRGSLGDHHMLRPCNPSVNGSRGNYPFGTTNSSGNYGYQGGYWYPGDADKGDIARICFYAATRWDGNGLSLVNGYPGGYQMGDLASLMKWHYEDVPDDFERSRNHKIYSSSYNPSYYTNNRNAYIDRPEYAWSVFMDQANDSRLYVGSGASADGSSTVDVDLGTVIVGGAGPASQSVTLHKTGLDGTYYSVSASGQATSTLAGRHNAFAMGSSGLQTFTVGLGADSSQAGVYTGAVVVDNLDVTTQGGAGRGANDGDDRVELTYTVLDHSEGSFSGSVNVDELEVDLGAFVPDSGPGTSGFSVHNLESMADATAGLDIDSVLGGGDADALEVNVTPTGTPIAAGDSRSYQATVDTSIQGLHQAEFTLKVSDENLAGATIGSDLVVTVWAYVAIDGDADLDGEVGSYDLNVILSNYGSMGGWTEGNFVGGTDEIDPHDLNVLLTDYGAVAGGGSTGGSPIPEPTSVVCSACFLATVLIRRRRGRRLD